MTDDGRLCRVVAFYVVRLGLEPVAYLVVVRCCSTACEYT